MSYVKEKGDATMHLNLLPDALIKNICLQKGDTSVTITLEALWDLLHQPVKMQFIAGNSMRKDGLD
jgi:hypothetical protein